MPNKKQRIIIALCILFAILLIGSIFYSTCSTTEKFEEKQKKTTTSEKSKKDSKTEESSTKLKLSTKEEEIFTDLLSNKLTDVNIDSLITSGVLTEHMIERFLNKITKDNFVVPPPLENNVNVPAKSKIVEGFTGFTSLTPMYATASSSETNQSHSMY